MKKVKMTQSEFFDNCEEYNGLCIHCSAIQYGVAEPDAESDFCTACGAYRIMGIETAAIKGYITIVPNERR